VQNTNDILVLSGGYKIARTCQKSWLQLLFEQGIQKTKICT